MYNMEDRLEGIFKLEPNGALIRTYSLLKKEQIIKFLNRNCVAGRKLKSLSIFTKALEILHVFVKMYGCKSNSRFEKFSREMFNVFFFFFRKTNPYTTFRKRVVKKRPNALISYYIGKHRRSAEVFRWFWLLSFKQPFRHVSQRYAFLLFDFIFYENNNIFSQLQSRMITPETNVSEKWSKAGKRRSYSRNNKAYDYYGQIVNI